MFFLKFVFLCFLQLLNGSETKTKKYFITNADMHNTDGYPLYDKDYIILTILYKYDKLIFKILKSKYKETNNIYFLEAENPSIELCKFFVEIIKNIVCMAKQPTLITQDVKEDIVLMKKKKTLITQDVKENIVCMDEQKTFITQNIEEAWSSYIKKNYDAWIKNQRLKDPNPDERFTEIFSQYNTKKNIVRGIHTEAIYPNVRNLMILFSLFLEETNKHEYNLLIEFCIKLKFKTDNLYQNDLESTNHNKCLFANSNDLYYVKDFIREDLCKVMYNCIRKNSDIDDHIFYILLDDDFLIYKNYYRKFLPNYNSEDTNQKAEAYSILYKIYNRNSEGTNYFKMLKDYICENDKTFKIIIFRQFHWLRDNSPMGELYQNSSKITDKKKWTTRQR